MAWYEQDNNDDAKVVVSGSYSRDGEERTDFLVFDKEAGTKSHYSIGAEGDSDLIKWHD